MINFNDLEIEISERQDEEISFGIIKNLRWSSQTQVSQLLYPCQVTYNSNPISR